MPSYTIRADIEMRGLVFSLAVVAVIVVASNGAQSDGDEYGATPLMRAAAVGSAAEVRTLLKSDADPNATTQAGATALMWATGDVDKVRALLDAGAAVNAATKDGDTALLTAARRGSLDVMRLLLSRGANPKTSARSLAELLRIAYSERPGEREVVSAAGLSLGSLKEAGTPTLGGYAPANADAIRALLDLGASPNPRGRFPFVGAAAFQGQAESVRVLIEHGADPNAKGQHDATVLMMASGAPTPHPDIVTLLLDHGAEINARDAVGRTALDWASTQGDTATTSLLKARGAARGSNIATAPLPVKTPRAARDAVVAAANTLLPVGDVLYRRRKCISCHHQTLPLMVMTLATKKGVADQREAARRTVDAITTVWNSRHDDLLLAKEVAGGANELSYGLVAFADAGISRNAATDAAVVNLLALQRTDGSWVFLDTRPPQADNSPVSFTAMAIRGLDVYAPQAIRPEVDRAIARARQYLRSVGPITTQDEAFKLLGLAWAKVANNEIAAETERLLALQRPDGGWGQGPQMAADAYATGEALFALQVTGTSVKGAAYRKGAAYLLREQLPDGTWFVRSRAFGFQPYFETGFPHGVDQFISASATAWAAIALLSGL